MKHKMIVIISMLLITLISITACNQNKSEENCPSKAIKIVVPVGAGGDTDINARIFAKYLENELKQPVVISNIAGASGTLGTRQVKDAKPDGYTVLFFHNTSILTQMRGLIEFDVFNDFKLVSVPLKDQTGVLVASAKKYNDLNDFIIKSQTMPAKVAASTGSLAHLIPLAFEKETGVKFNIVDAGGTAERIAALKGGHIDMFFAQYGVVQDYVKNGDFIVLGAVSEIRNPLMPNIPTFKEQGIDLVFEKFFYFAFPPNTPDKIVQVFSDSLKKISSDEYMENEFNKFYLTPEFNNLEMSKEYIGNTKDVYSEYNDVFVGN